MQEVLKYAITGLWISKGWFVWCLTENILSFVLLRSMCSVSSFNSLLVKLTICKLILQQNVSVDLGF